MTTGLKRFARQESNRLRKGFVGLDKMEFEMFLLGCGFVEVSPGVLSDREGMLLVTKLEKVLIISTDGARCQIDLTQTDLDIIFKAFTLGATVLIPIGFLVGSPSSARTLRIRKKKTNQPIYYRPDRSHVVMLKIQSFEWSIMDVNNFEPCLSNVTVKKREHLIKERVRWNLKMKGLPIPHDVKISWKSLPVSYFNVPNSCMMYACWIVEQHLSNLNDVDLGANNQLQNMMLQKIYAFIQQRSAWNDKTQKLLVDVARKVITSPDIIFMKKLEAEGRQNEILELQKPTETKLKLRSRKASNPLGCTQRSRYPSFSAGGNDYDD